MGSRQHVAEPCHAGWEAIQPAAYSDAEEDNVRTGFFEATPFAAVPTHLPTHLQPAKGLLRAP
jgi:hypothetical protein